MEKEKQLTTVEWFVIELRKLIKESELSDMRPSEFDTKEMMLIEQANKMFEEQVKDAWLEGNSTECDADGFAQRMEMEQYYNETFKSE